MKKKICVIGGGTGTHVSISALKNLDVDIAAIITVADSGGSTGRLRDEFGFLPVGDIRQALAALASQDQKEWIRELLLYRYSKGSGLEGHNLGNLILTALQDMTGSTAQAAEIAAQAFGLEGDIIPVTTKNVQLVVEYQDGTVMLGEHKLDDPSLGGKKIDKIKLSPRAGLYEKAKDAMLDADVIIIGPGDLYASVLPNMVVSGAKKALEKSKAKKIFIMNLMTRYTQTHRMTAQNHLDELVRYSGIIPDSIILNNQSIPGTIMKKYQSEHEYPVIDDLDTEKYTVIKSPVIKTTQVKKVKSDNTPRSFLRHDPIKLQKIFKKIIYE